AHHRVLDHRAQPVDALVGRGAVAHEVAQADDAGRAMRGDVGEHRLERLKVAVDVGHDGVQHHTSEGRNARAARSRTPLTNRPDSSPPYRLAISIASSSTTRTGVPGRPISSAMAMRSTERSVAA